ncbi:MAG: hypothetical protein GY716_07970 [bacterium]|nr:hypothetical protein [bacterium]
MNSKTLLLAFVALSLLSSLVDAQESATYSMERLSTTALGGNASSPDYESTPLLGQQSPTGAVSFCNIGFTGSLGYWSILGDLSLPGILRVDKSAPIDPAIDLQWSGNSAQFEVYRGFVAPGLVDAQNLFALTPLCSASDTQASEADVIYYLVVPQP